jgi:CHASE3 domain sensor protein
MAVLASICLIIVFLLFLLSLWTLWAIRVGDNSIETVTPVDPKLQQEVDKLVEAIEQFANEDPRNL